MWRPTAAAAPARLLSLPSSSSNRLPVSSLLRLLLLLSSPPLPCPASSPSSWGRPAWPPGGSARLGSAQLGLVRLGALSCLGAPPLPPPLPSSPECSAEIYIAPPRRRPKGDGPARRCSRAATGRLRSPGSRVAAAESGCRWTAAQQERSALPHAHVPKQPHKRQVRRQGGPALLRRVRSDLNAPSLSPLPRGAVRSG